MRKFKMVLPFWTDMDRYSHLKKIMDEKGPFVVAFSGGVDSSLVAMAGKDVFGKDVIGIMMINDTISSEERSNAQNIASLLDLELIVVEVDLIEDLEFISNNEDRCGTCRSITMPRLIDIARDRGYETVADGANVDDLNDYRPGHNVSTDLGIWHPLLEAGIGKEEARRILKEKGIPVWNRPSTPCMATRIPYYQRISREKLVIIERAEIILKGFGFKDVRFRLHETAGGALLGIIEVDHPEVAFEKWEEISSSVPLEKVYLDPRGYRQGSMNRVGGP
jgi:uncharacterized protein